VLLENRNGLVVNALLTQAERHRRTRSGAADVGSATAKKRVTMGADKAYDSKDFVVDLRACQVTPHVAQNNKRRRSAIDQASTRHPCYVVSQRKRRRVEEVFGG
jgi:hypothetical protein